MFSNGVHQCTVDLFQGNIAFSPKMELPLKFENMQDTTELPITEVINGEKARLIDKKEFDRKKESTLCTYNHRFLYSEDPGWELLKEKLIHMHQVYGKKKSVLLCSKCMTICKSTYSERHSMISVASIFSKIDIECSSPKEIAAFFSRYGRWRIDSKGTIKTCFPSFNQECDAYYPFLLESYTGMLLLTLQVQRKKPLNPKSSSNSSPRDDRKSQKTKNIFTRTTRHFLKE